MNWQRFFYGVRFGRKLTHFLKGLEIFDRSILVSARSDNTKSVKKNKQKYRNIENIFLRRWVCILVGSSYIFLKVLKFSINPYLGPRDRLILWRLKKSRMWINRNICYLLPPFVIGRKLLHFGKGLEITYLPIFLSA